MNTEEKIASVIEKIRHLQAKGGANATIDEMATATAIAAKLMAQYQISQAQVDLRNKTVSSFERRVIATASKRSNHLEILLDALCKLLCLSQSLFIALGDISFRFVKRLSLGLLSLCIRIGDHCAGLLICLCNLLGLGLLRILHHLLRLALCVLHVFY